MPKNFEPNKWINFVKNLGAENQHLCRGALINRDDIEQEAWYALYEADERYNASYGVKFSTFAIPAIKRKIQHLINRTNNKASVISQHEDWDGFEGSSQDPSKGVEIRDEVEKIMASSRYPELLMLHYGYSKSYRELARDLEMNHHQTIQRRIARDVETIRAEA
jgi:RNA polymerase sigma factor (sigma-70 family)